jgi:hypothetical protein
MGFDDPITWGQLVYAPTLIFVAIAVFLYFWLNDMD